MTSDQRTKLMAYWWPNACAKQGWQNTREQRLGVLSQIVGRPLASASELNTTDDIDRVKSRLLYLAENIDHEESAPEQGEVRRLRWQINQNGTGLVAKLLHDRFTWCYWLRLTHPALAGRPMLAAPANIIAQYRAADPHAPHLDDLNLAELTQLRNTLARVTHPPRPAAVSSDDQPQHAAIEADCPF